MGMPKLRRKVPLLGLMAMFPPSA